MEVVSGDNWSCKTCKAPVKSSPTNQQPASTGQTPFLSLNQQCTSTEVTLITLHWLAHPRLTWGSSDLVFDHQRLWLPWWGGVTEPLDSPDAIQTWYTNSQPIMPTEWVSSHTEKWEVYLHTSSRNCSTALLLLNANSLERARSNSNAASVTSHHNIYVDTSIGRWCFISYFSNVPACLHSGFYWT